MHTIPHRIRVPEGVFHYPYPIRYSGEFEFPNLDYLRINQAVAGDRRNWTLSLWFRNTNFTNNTALVFQGSAASTAFSLKFTSVGQLVLKELTSGVTDWQLASAARFRDDSHWYHILVTYTSSVPVDSNRVTVYLNGKPIPGGWASGTYPAEDFQSYINSANQMRIGNDFINDAWEGNIAQVAFLDGQIPGASQFGEFIGDTWVPKDISGLTFGDRGFLLDFSDAAHPEYDVSGNDNHFINSGVVQSADSPTDVYAVLDGRYPAPSLYGNVTHAGQVFTGSTNWSTRPLIIPLPTTGQWVVEVENVGGSPGDAGIMIGIMDHTFTNEAHVGTAISAYQCSGYIWENGVTITSGKAVWDTDGDKVQLVWRADNLSAQYFMDGVLQSSRPIGAYVDTRRTIYVAVSCNATGSVRVHCGQKGIEYDTGYHNAKPLHGAVLPDPQVRTGEEGCWAVKYSGNGTTQNVTGAEFDLSEPDTLLWLKRLDTIYGGWAVDTIRGAGKHLVLSLPDAEYTFAGGVDNFLSNGFYLGGNGAGFNASGGTYGAWAFKMLPQFGMDILQYEGTGLTRFDIPHSLGRPPEMIMIKSIDNATPWRVGHQYAHPSAPWSYVVSFDPVAKAAGGWASQVPNASVFGVGTDSNLNTSGKQYLASLFCSIPGFSKCGFYFGNGSYYGPRINLGFRPRFLLIKSIDDTYGWALFDSARDPDNPIQSTLYINGSNAEVVSPIIDFLSDGFKIQKVDNSINRNLYRFIYYAVAEMPYPFSNSY